MKKYLVLPLLLVLPLVMASCSDDDETRPTTPTASARVMAIHASPNAPSVDLYVDGAKAGEGLPFPQNTAYLTVTPGTRNVKVNVFNTSTTVINADLPIAANKNYSVFAIDSVSRIDALVIEDNLTAPASGKAHVRFVHLSPNAPAVNITLTDGTVVFGNKAFKEYTEFTPLDAGAYNLQVRDAATNSAVVLSLDNVTLQAGKIYTVWASGFLGGTGDQALNAQIIVNN